MLTSALVLIFSSPGESFVVYCDASKMVLGGALMHNGQVVAYASRHIAFVCYCVRNSLYLKYLCYSTFLEVIL